MFKLQWNCNLQDKITQPVPLQKESLLLGKRTTFG